MHEKLAGKYPSDVNLPAGPVSHVKLVLPFLDLNSRKIKGLQGGLHLPNGVEIQAR